MELILKYFPEISQRQKEQFILFEKLISEWNQKINLISRKEIPFICERHILHSLAIARIISFHSGTKVLDVGTGGGFPGIPLAILFTGSRFELVDSIGKKIKVVNDIIQKLNLSNCAATNTRVENLNSKYDFIVSRAVTSFPKFHEWTRNRLNTSNHQNLIKNGILYLKGGDLDEEMRPFKGKYKEYFISDFFREDFFNTKKIIYFPFTNKKSYKAHLL